MQLFLILYYTIQLMLLYFLSIYRVCVDCNTYHLRGSLVHTPVAQSPANDDRRSHRSDRHHDLLYMVRHFRLYMIWILICGTFYGRAICTGYT